MIKYKQLVYLYILSLLILYIFTTGCITNSTSKQIDKSTWTTYTDKSDGFKILHPPDWSITVTKTTPMKIKDPLFPYLTMENIIHIYTSDTNAAVQIMGLSYPPSLYSDNGITDEAYNLLVTSLSTTKGDVIPLSITRDENSYIINENSVRHLQATVLLNNEAKITDNYIIRHDKVYYIITYIMYESSAEQYSQTAMEIIKTFKTVEWST